MEHRNSITNEELKLASTSAIQLIGNANARLSRLRREKIIQSVNKSLLPMVKDDTPYAKASPDLFGTDFARKSKEFIDQVKAFRSSLPTASKYNQEKKSLFRKANPLGKGGAYKRGGAYSNQRFGGRRD